MPACARYPAASLFFLTMSLTMMISVRPFSPRCHAFVPLAAAAPRFATTRASSSSPGSWTKGPKSFQPYIRTFRGGSSSSPSSFKSNSHRRHHPAYHPGSGNSGLFSTGAVLEQEAAVDAKLISGTASLRSFGGIRYRDTNQQDESFRVVFVLGGPGAGKGTQCELLLKSYPCVHLSAGQLLREEAQKKGTSPHAALIEECLVEGKIVPVEISLTLLQNAMREAHGKSLIFLIDGFPRNFDNLEGWTQCMAGVADVWGALYYQCPLSVLEQRVMARSKDSGRSDDNLESLRRRFKTFEDETVPVINTLRLVEKDNKSLLKVLDIAGDQSLEQVWEDTQKSLNSFVVNDVMSSNVQLLEAVATNDVDTYRSLCADELFETITSSKEGMGKNGHQSSGGEALNIMRIHEGKVGEFTQINAKCAELVFVTGTKVSLSYDRTSDLGTTFRETRIWSHQGPKGWRMVYFLRSAM